MSSAESPTIAARSHPGLDIGILVAVNNRSTLQALGIFAD